MVQELTSFASTKVGNVAVASMMHNPHAPFGPM
jgi:hypothetical protein